MKIIDFDALYDKFVEEFLQAKKGKYSVGQLEDLQPTLYKKFSTLKIKNIGSITVDEYYFKYKDSLIDILKEHIRRDVSVNEFLLNALAKYVSESVLIENLQPSFSGEYLWYIIKVLTLQDSKNAFNRYIDLLFIPNLDTEVENLLVDILKENADFVLDNVIKTARENYPSAICELLSYSTKNVDFVAKFLGDEIQKNLDKIPEYCSYIVKVGSQSSLEVLLKIIDMENISYIDFKELKLAIEFLGGEYNKERDFSSDKNYILLKQIKVD